MLLNYGKLPNFIDADSFSSFKSALGTTLPLALSSKCLTEHQNAWRLPQESQQGSLTSSAEDSQQPEIYSTNKLKALC